MTADSARCTHLRGLPHDSWGNLSVIMHLGDASLHEDGIQCFKPNQDILLPAYSSLRLEPMADVSLHQRTIKVLYRFATDGHTASKTYHHRLLRPELQAEHKAHPLPGSNWGLESINQTMEDMSRSIFCVCPPGIVAHTSRFWRSLRRGCIPVTFFKDYQLPLSDYIDYAGASVNILPENVQSFYIILKEVLGNATLQGFLQDNVQTIQTLLVWDGDKGIQKLFGAELSKRIII